uniref:Anoctamin dimerisation domain-containing protein n=1 Tax=Romanomermis culicivorax TaxID=13658 RepID=A0A915HIF9_ROMCU
MTDGKRKIDFILIYERHESPNQKTGGEPDLTTQATVNGVGGAEMIAMVETEAVDRSPTVAVEINHQNHHGSAAKGLHHVRREFFHENLIKEGLEIELENVDDLDRPITVVKVHAPFSTLCRYAEELHIKVPLKIYDRLTISNIDVQHSDGQAIRNSAVSQIVYEILQQTPNNPDDARHRGIAALLEHKIYEIAYPLHDSDILHMDASEKMKFLCFLDRKEDEKEGDKRRTRLREDEIGGMSSWPKAQLFID